MTNTPVGYIIICEDIPSRGMRGGFSMAEKKCPHCRTKERSDAEVKDLITRLNRIEGQI